VKFVSALERTGTGLEYLQKIVSGEYADVPIGDHVGFRMEQVSEGRIVFTNLKVVTNVEGQKSGLLFYGLNNASWAPTPWGIGSTSFLCVKSPTQRTPTQNSGGTINTCNGSFSIDWNAYIANTAGALGTPFVGGETVYAQGWFRDPPAPKTTNLSNALQFLVCP
jgi:hypothetical protein